MSAASAAGGFALTAFAASALAFALASAAARLRPDWRDWPALWAAALAGALAAALIALATPFDALGAWPDGWGSPFGGGGPEAFGAAGSGEVNRGGLRRGGGRFWPQIVAVAGQVYVAGVCVALGRLAVGRLRVGALVDAAVMTGWRDGVPVLLSSAAPAPFAVGAGRRARIVVPQAYGAALSEEDLALVVAHERAHVARADDAVGLALRVATAVMWHAPFAGALRRRWSRAVEVHCDAQTLRDTQTLGDAPAAARRRYAALLVKSLRLSAGGTPAPVVAFINRRTRSEKMRIETILTGRTPVRVGAPAYRRLAAAASVAALTAGLALSGVASADAGRETTPTIVEGRITAVYGPLDGRRDADGAVIEHRGVDVAAPLGTAVRAPADGVVVTATERFEDGDAYGTVVTMRSEQDVVTLFAHLQSFDVAPGDAVRAGQIIARVGTTGRSTGPHVHIETFIDGARVDPATVWPNLKAD
ncbi:MAG: M23/M56 family metallopeptidase [Pseudomonadota bacterium]